MAVATRSMTIVEHVSSEPIAWTCGGFGHQPEAGCSESSRRIRRRAAFDHSRWMWGVLLLFFVMHLLDSVDRWLFAAVFAPDQ